MDIDDYIATLKKSNVIRIVPIDEEIWLESVKLEWEHKDPVDRVVVAVAKINRASIITADRKIADFYPLVIWSITIKKLLVNYNSLNYPSKSI